MSVIPRDFYLTAIRKGFKAVPIVVLIGARQVGKTTITEGYVSEQKSVTLIGQDPEVAALFQKLSVIETYLKVYLHPELKGLLVIDEFQYVDGVSLILKLLTDKYKNLRVLCSGSSSLDILQKLEESLAGRIRMIEVFSLSFSEYIMFQSGQLAGLYNSIDIYTEDSALIHPIGDMLNEYLLFGGLPRAALVKDPDEKLAIIDDIYKTYLMKDVRSYVKNEDFVGFNKLLRILAVQVGGLTNINALSRETGLSYRRTEEYIYLLEQMYIIRLISPYFTNKRKIITKMKKVYFSDLGLRNIIAGNFGEISIRPDKGKIFENYVLLELQRNLSPAGNIYYYRTIDGVEVDFVVDKLTRRQAVECKFKQFDHPVSIKSLVNFSEMENIDERYVINQNLNSTKEGTKFLQGYLAGKIR